MKIRALLLAAGRGERLRPLTATLPKPLLPLSGKSVAERTLDRLVKTGCEAVMINLHHLGEQIAESLGTEHLGCRLEYSREEELLGTWGALKKTREFFASSDCLLIVNGDSFCHWPFKSLLRRHQKCGALVTMLLNRRVDPDDYGGGVPIDDQGKVMALRQAVPDAAGRGIFMGAQVLSSQILQRLDAGPESGDLITLLHQPLLREGGSIVSASTRRWWHDLGTPSRYLEGAIDSARGWPRLGRSWVAEDANVAEGAKVRNSMIEHGVTLGESSVVEQCAVLEGAEVGPSSHLKRCVIGPGVVLPAGSQVQSRMVTLLSGGRGPAGEDSVMGDLVYTRVR